MIRKLAKYLALILSLSALSVLANEDVFNPSVEFKSKVEKLLDLHKENRINYFKGPEGLVGAAIRRKDGGELIVYITSSGDHILSGVVVNTKTMDDIRKDHVKYMPALDIKPILADMDSTNGIKVGDGKVRVYAFVDAECGFCKREYGELKDKNITVKWIPVGLLGETSKRHGAHLIDKGGKASLDNIFGDRSKPLDIGNSERANQKLDSNNAIFEKYSKSGVPFLVVVNGNKVQMTNGFTEFDELNK